MYIGCLQQVLIIWQIVQCHAEQIVQYIITAILTADGLGLIRIYNQQIIIIHIQFSGLLEAMKLTFLTASTLLTLILSHGR